MFGFEDENRPEEEVVEESTYTDSHLDMNSLETYGFSKADDYCKSSVT